MASRSGAGDETLERQGQQEADHGEHGVAGGAGSGDEHRVEERDPRDEAYHGPR